MNNPFEKIVGQETIVSRLMTSINSPENTRLAQPLFFGEAGLGKTEIGRAYANGIAEKLGCEVLFFNSPAEFRHSESAELQTLLNWFADETGVLVIDECHLFDSAKTVAMLKVQSFLLKCLDGQNAGKLIQFDQDNSFTYDKSKKVIILMTNYPNKVNPALASRMDTCTLQPYTHHELEKICVQMLAENGMTAACEKTVALMAKASRGTARPLYNMIQHFSRLGLEIIDMQTTVETMRTLDMFPRGLNMDEIRLLKLASKPTTKSIAQMAITGLEKTLSKSLAYMMGHGLVTALNGGQFKTSAKGQKFLSSLQALNFIA